jgi:GNAT superfamily N-acetyltransferase
MSDINYVVIDYNDLYPAKKSGGNKKVKKNKKIKSLYLRDMKELYERGFKLNDFKSSSSFKNDIAILMYKNDSLLGFVFIKENREQNNITNGITDPFFYNLVIDPKYQHGGYGSTLLEHIKHLYFNRPLYCLVESTNKNLHEWYDKRDGVVFNDPTMTWAKGYFVYIFTNGSSDYTPAEPTFATNLHKTEEFQTLRNKTIDLITKDKEIPVYTPNFNIIMDCMSED